MREPGTKTTPVFLPTDGEASGCYFQVQSPYYQTAQCNQKTLFPYLQGDRSGLRKPKKDKYQH